MSEPAVRTPRIKRQRATTDELPLSDSLSTAPPKKDNADRGPPLTVVHLQGQDQVQDEMGDARLEHPPGSSAPTTPSPARTSRRRKVLNEHEIALPFTNKPIVSEQEAVREQKGPSPIKTPLKRSESDSVLTPRATKTRSPYFKTPVKRKHVGAGKPELSCNSVPPLTAKSFGLIQERYWDNPFQMMVAVIFLNRTKGIAAIPVFLQLIERYPTPEAMAAANQEDICRLIQHLGFQHQRAKGLVELAQVWLERPPDRARRYRTLNYPNAGDGRDIKAGEVLAEDDERRGGLEVAHLPRLGPYGWDSWRIYCRDKLRGLADDYNGAGAGAGFQPEWKRVLPLDKELRACLRWMWLREGIEWDPSDGSRRAASPALVARANTGTMLWADLVPDEMDRPSPLSLAAQAALSTTAE